MSVKNSFSKTKSPLEAAELNQQFDSELENNCRLIDS